MLKRSAGIVYLIPLLIVAFAAISVLALSLEAKPQKSVNTAVLSESESGGSGRGGDSSGSSGSSGSSNTSSEEIRTESTTTSTSRPATLLKPRETEEPDEVENEQEHADLEIENENEVEVHEGTEAARVRIGKRQDKFTFFEQKFGAESEFPVSVDKVTRELSIETPQGTKVVAILPDAAIENMLGQNIIDRILGVNGQLVEIKIDENGNVFYEISGAKDEKFLGFLNVMVPKTLNVSTETGNVTKIDQDLLSKLLDALSF